MWICEHNKLKCSNLLLGLSYFLKFAQQAEVINASQETELWQRCWNALKQVAKSQFAHQADSDPVNRFLELIASAIASGHAHVASTSGSEPDEPQAWGWREKTIGSGNYTREEWQSQGDRIGWLEGLNLYLDPYASNQAAQHMAGNNGEVIPIAVRTLHKRMKERGMLLSRDDTSDRLTIRCTLEGTRRRVIHLHIDTLIDHKPGQLGQMSPQEVKNQDCGPVSWPGSTLNNIIIHRLCRYERIIYNGSP